MNHFGYLKFPYLIPVQEYSVIRFKRTGFEKGSVVKAFSVPPNLINIKGHELEGAFIVHALACLGIYGHITH